VKVFVPFSEALIEQYGCNLGELVPFRLEYECFAVELTEAQDDNNTASYSDATAVQSTRRHGISQ
jgi:hypothetical protein